MPNIAATRPVAGQPIETAWGQNVHDAVEAVLDMAYGLLAITGTGATTASAFVTFAKPFSASPIVQATAAAMTDGSAQMVATIADRSTTQMRVILQRTDGATINAGTYYAYWTAVGVYA